MTARMTREELLSEVARLKKTMDTFADVLEASVVEGVVAVDDPNALAAEVSGFQQAGGRHMDAAEWMDEACRCLRNVRRALDVENVVS